jgi:hypothetical protein
VSGPAIGVLRGLIDPLPKGPAAPANKTFFWFPWSQIKAYAYVSLAGNPRRFNWAKASYPEHGSWQISIWYDALYPIDEDDIADLGGVVWNINDWAPNVGQAPFVIDPNVCEGNFNSPEDEDVDGADAAKFKTDFGRNPFFNPCPPYPAPITY